MEKRTLTGHLSKLFLTQKGFTLLYAVIMTAIILFIGTSSIALITRQLSTTTTSENSQEAFYAAQSATECLTYYAEQGTFEASSGNIVCDGVTLSFSGASPFSFVGMTFTNPTTTQVSCADATIDTEQHLITAKGYNSCDSTLPTRVERAISYNYACGGLSESGLVGYWSFEEPSGDTAYDESPNCLIATLMNGATRVPGRVGQGVSLDGVDDFLEVMANDIVTDVRPMTITMWVYPRTIDPAGVYHGPTYGDLTTILVSTDVFDQNNGHSLMLGNSRLLGWWKDCPGYILKESNNNLITLNAWQHVAMTWDGNAPHTGVKLYINGSETAYIADGTNSSCTSVPNQNVPMRLHFGADYDYSDGDEFLGVAPEGWHLTGALNGIIDEIRIYNRVLSGAEILSASGMPSIPTTGLVSRWRFSETTGTSAVDAQGTNTGTLYNGTTVALGPAHASGGKVGYGLQFDGVDDRVNVPASASLNNLPAFTYAAWVKPDTANQDANIGMLFVKGASGALGSKRFGINSTDASCGVGNNLCLEFSVNRATTDATAVSAANSVPTATWTFVTATYSATDGPRIYLNGQQATYRSRVVGSGAAESESANALSLGTFPDRTASFDGTFDEAFIYNRVLTPSEVNDLYIASQQ